MEHHPFAGRDPPFKYGSLLPFTWTLSRLCVSAGHISHHHPTLMLSTSRHFVVAKMLHIRDSTLQRHRLGNTALICDLVQDYQPCSISNNVWCFQHTSTLSDFPHQSVLFCCCTRCLFEREPLSFGRNFISVQLSDGMYEHSLPFPPPVILAHTVSIRESCAICILVLRKCPPRHPLG